MPEPGGDYVDLPAAGRLLWKRRWLGAGVWLAIGLACAPYAFTAAPRYTAAATLVVESPPLWHPVSGERVMRSYWWWHYYLRTQRRLLSSRTLARRTLDRTGLWTHGEFARSGPSPGPGPLSAAVRQEAVIDRFLQRLRVTWPPDTYLFSVAFTSEDATVAADVANALAEEHVAWNLESERRMSPAAIEAPGQQASESGVPPITPGAGGIRVLDRAETPTVPSSSDRGLLLLLALAGGFAATVVAVFVAERLDNRLTTAEAVREHLGQPVLGILPRTGPDEPDGPDGSDAGRAALRDALRFACVNLVSAPASPACGDRRVVAVTSALTGEGKTFASVRLAESLAQTGRRVLLIDADCRRSSVHGHFGLPAQPGLADVLAGRDVPPARACRDVAPGLAVLAAGAAPPDPAGLLESSRFEALLAELAEDFDWTVIDTPPVLAEPDAALVAHAAGDVLLVDRRGHAVAAPGRRRAAAARGGRRALSRRGSQRRRRAGQPLAGFAAPAPGARQVVLACMTRRSDLLRAGRRTGPRGWSGRWPRRHWRWGLPAPASRRGPCWPSTRCSAACRRSGRSRSRGCSHPSTRHS